MEREFTQSITRVDSGLSIDRGKIPTDAFHCPFMWGKPCIGGEEGGFPRRDPGSVLFKRLMEHARSIDQAENLNLEDFYCRFLVVDDIWIPLGESVDREILAALESVA